MSKNQRAENGALDPWSLDLRSHTRTHLPSTSYKKPEPPHPSGSLSLRLPVGRREKNEHLSAHHAILACCFAPPSGAKSSGSFSVNFLANFSSPCRKRSPAKGVWQKSDEKSDRSVRKSDRKVTESVPKTKKSDRTPFAALLLRHPDSLVFNQC